MATKLAIIGDGNVGSALARGLQRAGHEVRAVGLDATMTLAVGFTTSGAEELQKKLPKARVVKAFNNPAEGRMIATPARSPGFTAR